MSNVIASFEVFAGTTAEGELDTDGLTPDEIAELIEARLSPGYISLCHQCSHEISDPETGDLAGFSVDGKYYEKINGTWQEEVNR